MGTWKDGDVTPAERVPMLRRVAGRLAEFVSGDIDLHLREFGFPSRGWFQEEEDYDYALRQLSKGADENLVQLDAFLFGNDPDPSDTDLVWMPATFRLFISHISPHKDDAMKLAKVLHERYNVHGFVAHEAIKPNLMWQQTILNSLRTCDALVALLRPKFHESNWTDQEIGYVLGRSRPVLSVRLGVDPYGFFSVTQAISGTGKRAPEISQEIVTALASDPRCNEALRDALVQRLATAGSFDHARELMGYLEATPAITVEQYEMLGRNASTNVQLGSCTEYPSFMKRHRPANMPRPDPVYGDEEPF